MIMQALGTTILATAGAAFVSTILGTMACIGMLGMRKRTRTWIMGLTNIPMLNADIVTGVALMLLFSRFISLSFWTMLIAHITLIIPYVVLCVQPKVMHLNMSMYEAALDLGASHSYAFWKVVLPELVPGIVAGFMLSFTMSLDDFSVTYFTKAPGIHTMSTMINAEYRKGIQTELYALSTIVFVLVLLVLFLMNRKAWRTTKKAERERGRAFMRKRTMLSRLTAAGMAVLLSGIRSADGMQARRRRSRTSGSLCLITEIILTVMC